jgi:hypothetical protein
VAILIQINKVAEWSDVVIYEYGPAEGIVGQVALDKKTGRVEVFELAPQGARRNDF